MNSFTIRSALLGIALLFTSHANAGERELPGDIVTALLPLVTVGTTYFKDDQEGRYQFYRSTGVSLVVNSILRLGFDQTDLGERPNGSPYGFPSGHIGFTTSSAAFLQDRYGWKYGLPAYAAVGYVAWVRVDTDHHRWRDVGAAALLSYSLSKLFVTPENATQIAPIVGPDWLGLRWQRSF